MEAEPQSLRQNKQDFEPVIASPIDNPTSVSLGLGKTVEPASSSAFSDKTRLSNHHFDSHYTTAEASPNTPLLKIQRTPSNLQTDSQYSNQDSDLESQHTGYGSVDHDRAHETTSITHNHSNWKKRVDVWAHEHLTTKSIIQNGIKLPASYLPSVFLGTLLNILDGLSYGLILFPTSIPVFSSMGPSGLSIFYISCIVSQLCFSLGLSKFPISVGSEMIEVVPFFHIIAGSLVADIGADNPQSVLATTLVAFSVSSVMTGLVFFLLGYLKIGNVVNFFPRHILVGCIGGVGYFLFITGVGVSSGLGENVPYTLKTLQFLLEPAVLVKWTTPLILAAVLVLILHRFDGAYVVPFYFVTVFLAIHLIIWMIPGYSLDKARGNGWLFEGPKNRNEPWWYFYTLLDFKAVNVIALLKTVPTMLALTFFGILHVPINVPALAAAAKMDDVDINRELVAHGVSNTLSGFCGSIQNYLVYTNSVFVIKTGANGRFAGVMLAFATMAVMMVGPVVVGYIPVSVVAALIYLLAHDLLKEALWDTFRAVNTYEYLTIFSIVAVMGLYDFVWGIVFGIILACGFFTIQLSSTSVIRATFTGSVARSTVRRNANIQKYLYHVGDQIFVMKLAGSIFFGTINEVESHVKGLIDDKKFKTQPIRYLILDLTNILDLDFSAMKGFYNIKRKLEQKKVFMLIVTKNKEYLHRILSANEMTPKIYSDNDNGKGTASRNLPFEEMSEAQIAELSAESESSGTSQHNSFSHSHPNYIQDVDFDDDSLLYIYLFCNLNFALEWCENCFLKEYFAKRVEIMEASESAPTSLQPVTLTDTKQTNPFNNHIPASPRFSFVQQAADTVVRSDPLFLESRSRWKQLRQPIPLLIKTFDGVTIKGNDFWQRVAPHFKRIKFQAGQVLFELGAEAQAFYVVESGVLRADHESKQGSVTETIVAGTTCGELPFFSESTRSARVFAETDAVVWYLSRAEWESLRQTKPDGADIANKLYLMALKFTVERYDTNLAYTLISSA